MIGKTELGHTMLKLAFIHKKNKKKTTTTTTTKNKSIRNENLLILVNHIKVTHSSNPVKNNAQTLDPLKNNAVLWKRISKNKATYPITTIFWHDFWYRL